MSLEDFVTKRPFPNSWDERAIRILEELLHHGDYIGVFGSVPDAELTRNRASWRVAFKKCAPALLIALNRLFGEARGVRQEPIWYDDRRKWFYENIVTAAGMTTAPPFRVKKPKFKTVWLTRE